MYEGLESTKRDLAELYDEMERSKRELTEMRRLYLRLDARMEGAEGHVDNLYREIRAMREDMRTVLYHADKLNESFIKVYDIVIRTNQLLMTMTDRVGDLDSRVTVLEKR